MEFSKRSIREQKIAQADSSPQTSDALKEVVALSGLPETLVHQELSTTKGEAMTLDELRAVMLQYLESIQESVQAEFAESAETVD